MNISFTENQEEYIRQQISFGNYTDASELISEALQMHELYRNKILEELRIEINKGWNGPISDRSINDIIASKGF